jgi:hypothetical protein
VRFLRVIGDNETGPALFHGSLNYIGRAGRQSRIGMTKIEYPPDLLNFRKYRGDISRVYLLVRKKVNMVNSSQFLFHLQEFFTKLGINSGTVRYDV